MLIRVSLFYTSSIIISHVSRISGRTTNAMRLYNWCSLLVPSFSHLLVAYCLLPFPSTTPEGSILCFTSSSTENYGLPRKITDPLDYKMHLQPAITNNKAVGTCHRLELYNIEECWRKHILCRCLGKASARDVIRWNTKPKLQRPRFCFYDVRINAKSVRKYLRLLQRLLSEKGRYQSTLFSTNLYQSRILSRVSSRKRCLWRT